MKDGDILPTCVTQSVQKLPLGCFDVVNNKTEEKTHQVFKMDAEAVAEMHIDEAEDGFCLTLPKREYIPSILRWVSSVTRPNCGISTSLPKTSRASTQSHLTAFWKYVYFRSNVFSIRNFLSSCLQRQRKIYAMTGIQTPMLYIGSPLTSFSWHTEDGNLGSISYLHKGAPKFW